MHRALALAALLVTPTLALSAQGSRAQESDSSESSAVRAVGAVGGVGFSLLRLALHRNDDGPAQQFCYSACGNSRQSAALQLTPGPTRLRLGHGDGPEGNNRPASVNAGANANSADKAKLRNVRGPNGDDNARDGDLFDFVENPANSNGLKPLFPDHPGLGDGADIPWVDGSATGCAMHTCSTDMPLTPGSNGWLEGGNLLPPTSSGNNSGDWVNQQMPVIVNPEPGTWALLAAGMGGLALVGRRRRR